MFEDDLITPELEWFFELHCATPLDLCKIKCQYQQMYQIGRLREEDFRAFTNLVSETVKQISRHHKIEFYSLYNDLISGQFPFGKFDRMLKDTVKAMYQRSQHD